MPKPQPRRMPPGVHHKRAKGRDYYYFDTGARRNGRPVLKRLPDITDIEFGPAYAAALSGRTRTGNAAQAALTVKELCDKFQRSVEFGNLADNTQRAYLLYLKSIEANLGKAPVDDVRRSDVLRLRDSFGDRRGAANLVVSVTTALYAWAREHDFATVKPTEDIKPYDSKDYEPWPDDLIEAALVDPDIAIRSSVALLYFTAQRIGDVCRMRWTDIRSDFLEVTQEKTGKLLAIPVHARLRDGIGPTAGLGTILMNGGKPFTAAALRARLTKWAAGKGFKIVPHGLRKSAVNSLLEVGCSVAETAAISGQSLQVVEHYAKRRNLRKLGSAAILKWERNKA